MSEKYIVTGGAGFIGVNFIYSLLKKDSATQILNIDKLTYAGNPNSLTFASQHQGYRFLKADIIDEKLIFNALDEFKPTKIVHFAAESHVDRSIDGPDAFVRTNIMGTYNLLKLAFRYFDALTGSQKDRFRFLHVSTDEVFGSLGKQGFFTEDSRYAPNSPYSASKAASDHLTRAWHKTYGFPLLTTNCSNNYGPYQFPEKLIPVILLNALEGKPVPIYGDGSNIRDWLYVEDHCEAIQTVINKGKTGETYNIGGANEMSNLRLAETLLTLLDEIRPKKKGSYLDLISFVKDRPGHDMRYAISIDKIKKELGWQPKESFLSGIKKTIHWYLEHEGWVKGILSGEYKIGRLGLGEALKNVLKR
ncbi:MAG: dTDP-glucose 4,6-dehydratase [Deltaproteobacteria bacterium]|nr:dTDP-glucose 4,6-dehydratase [Deltaproteobacteria bacterium]